MKVLLLIFMMSPYGEKTVQVKEHFSMYACKAEASRIMNEYPAKVTTMCLKEGKYD